MPLKVIHKNGSKMIEVRFSGELTEEDCDQFVLAVEGLIRQYAQPPLLIDMTEFAGVNTAFHWSENRFSAIRFGEIKRLAVIGDTLWQKIMAAFSKPFTGAKVRYFAHTEPEKARIWLCDG